MYEMKNWQVTLKSYQTFQKTISMNQKTAIESTQMVKQKGPVTINIRLLKYGTIPCDLYIWRSRRKKSDLIFLNNIQKFLNLMKTGIPNIPQSQWAPNRRKSYHDTSELNCWKPVIKRKNLKAARFFYIHIIHREMMKMADLSETIQAGRQ